MAHAWCFRNAVNTCILGDFVRCITHVCILLDGVGVFVHVAGLLLDRIKAGRRTLGRGCAVCLVRAVLLGLAVCDRLFRLGVAVGLLGGNVGLGVAGVVHEEAQAVSGQAVQLVADCVALGCGGLALVEPFQEVVAAHAPEEKEGRGEGGEEDGGEEDDESGDDGEDGEADGDEEADDKGDDDGEDEHGDGEENEKEQGRAGQGNVGEKKGLA